MKKYIICFVMAVAFIPTQLFSEQYRRDLKVVQPRMNGSDVLSVQKCLLELGFSDAGEADGFYGPKAESAVKRYQEFAGFTVNGVVGRALWDFMFSSDATIVKINKDISYANTVKLSKYKIIEAELTDYSTESGTLRKYTDDGAIKYAEIEILGEMGKIYYKAYFREGRCLVSATDYDYPAPFDVENAKITMLMYYYQVNQTVKFQNGVMSKVKYDAPGVMEIIAIY